MIRCLALAALLLFHGGDALAAEKVFNAESMTLENGLQVVVIPNHRAPVVKHMVWYRVGRADEPPGVSGIAHFLEHLMFKGSGDLPPGAFSKTIRALGGNDNAFTSQDYTAFHQSIAVEHLAQVMRMEAGRMRDLHPPAEHVASEHQVILEERRQRTDNDPRARFQEQIQAALFVNHPYNTPVIGWMHEMESLDWTAAKTFYDRWYGPNNAIVIVAGDVTAQQVFALAQEIYGPLKPVPLPPRQRLQSPPLPGAVTLTMRDKDVHEPLVQQVYRVPSYRQNAQDSLALQVYQNIMDGGASAQLYQALVVRQKIASDVGMSYNPNAWDDGTMWFYAMPAEGQTPAAVQTALENELRAMMADDGFNDADLQDAIGRLQAEAVYARDSLEGPAMIVGLALTTGTSLQDVETWPQAIAAVTAAQVRDAARRYLNPDDTAARPRVTAYLLPQPPEKETPAQ